MLAGPMIACGAPFLLGGSLALAYDITMWHSFRDVAAAAAVAKGRHRLRRPRAHGATPNPADVSEPPALFDDGPPTIAISTMSIDDTTPLNLRYDPVERVRARRRATTELNAPRGFPHWEAVHDHLLRPQHQDPRSDPSPSAGPHPTKGRPATR
jgi:hypothetical protein